VHGYIHEIGMLAPREDDIIKIGQYKIAQYNDMT